LLKVTPRNSPERPALLRRLAEAYAELAKLAETDRENEKVHAEEAERLQKTDKPFPRRQPRRSVVF
jgi:hypothetical protein